MCLVMQESPESNEDLPDASILDLHPFGGCGHGLQDRSIQTLLMCVHRLSPNCAMSASGKGVCCICRIQSSQHRMKAGPNIIPYSSEHETTDVGGERLD